MAELTDQNSVRVGDQTYCADNILIAVGGTPRRLGVPGEVSVLHSSSLDVFMLLTEIHAGTCY